MSCILPDPGFVTVSMDLAAGEPSCTAHFSRDVRYRYATIDGVGKAPFYDGGVLMIDDIYLMVMSVSPMGKNLMREMFDRRWEGRTFVEQWRVDPEVIKSALKKQRQFHKILALGLGYGMGAAKMCKSAFEAGYDLDLPTAKQFFRAYWNLFSGVKRLADRLAAQIEQDGYIVNPFGYRLSPPPRKAFNYYIQSSVSGIMHVFVAKLMAIAPYAHFITVIHDELVADCPVDMVDEFRQAALFATQSLNDDLGWTVNIRTGFVAGRNWLEAK